jgi:hypothetical protein
MSIAIRIKDCIDNHDQYVSIMAAIPDKELAKKLDLVHIQSEIAEQTNNISSLELLEVWRHQIIEARIYKAENNIPDAANEIELAISDIETVVTKTEERAEILNEYINPAVKQARPKNQAQQDNYSQLSLF